MRVHVVDPSAYTPPYDHALCAALARAGADVELVTSRFAARRGAAPRAATTVREGFYRCAPARAARAARGAGSPQHVPDMLRYRRRARAADVVHFQWLAVQPLDAHLLPRRAARSCSPPTTSCRASRAPGQRARSGASTSASTRSSCTPSTARARLRRRARRRRASASHVIPHGAFDHLRRAATTPLPPELPPLRAARSCCSSACCAPTRGSTCCSRRGAGSRTPSCGSSAMPRMDTAPLRAAAPPSVRFVPRFVADAELAGALPPRRPRRAALPRDRPVRRALHRARVRHAAAAQRRRRLPRGRGRPARPSSSPPGDPAALPRAREPARRPGARAPRWRWPPLRRGRRGATRWDAIARAAPRALRASLLR